MTEEIIEVEEDRPYMVVNSGYLKLPSQFKKKFGIGTGSNLGHNFPNPKTGMAEDGDKVQLIYTFNKGDLEQWQKERELESSKKANKK
jgi:hypothetical protein